jgi:hypothetical protein
MHIYFHTRRVLLIYQIDLIWIINLWKEKVQPKLCFPQDTNTNIRYIQPTVPASEYLKLATVASKCRVMVWLMWPGMHSLELPILTPHSDLSSIGIGSSSTTLNLGTWHNYREWVGRFLTMIFEWNSPITVNCTPLPIGSIVFRIYGQCIGIMGR